jgi:hypothetical protein
MSSTQLHMRSSYVVGSGMPDYGFGRCDGHHEMVDFRLKKCSGLRLFRAMKKSPGRAGALGSNED